MNEDTYEGVPVVKLPPGPEERLEDRISYKGSPKSASREKARTEVSMIKQKRKHRRKGPRGYGQFQEDSLS